MATTPDRLTEVGRDIASFAPDRHREWADDNAQCDTPSLPASVRAGILKLARREAA